MKLSRDSVTSRFIVTADLIKFLDSVLRNPTEHRKILPKAVQIAVKAFQSCVARVGDGYTTMNKEELQFVVYDGQG